MVYKHMVTKMLVVDSLILASTLSFSIYSFISSFKNIDRETAIGAKAVSILFALIFIASAINSFGRIRDYMSYLGIGDSYLGRTSCVISKHLRGTVGGLFGNESFRCTDGRKFYIRYTFKYRRWIWRQEGQKVYIVYLPLSRTVLDIQKRNAP